MNPVPSPLRAVALLTAASLLALTGCSASEPTTDATSTPETSTSAEPTEVIVDDKPALSAPAILRPGGPEKQVNSGIVSWETRTGKGLNAAQARRLSVLADEFITEHYLRPDRWQGKYVIKEGELDAMAAKFVPKAFADSMRNVAWWGANQEKFGNDARKWPKKQRAMSDGRLRSIGGLFVTNSGPDGGKGEIRNEFIDRIIWVNDDGNPSAWTQVRSRRTNNTGTPRFLLMRQTFKQVDGKWLISGTSWEFRDSEY